MAALVLFALNNFFLAVSNRNNPLLMTPPKKIMKKIHTKLLNMLMLILFMKKKGRTNVQLKPRGTSNDSNCVSDFILKFMKNNHRQLIKNK